MDINNVFYKLNFGIAYEYVKYNNETFKATTQLNPTTVIENVEQGDGTLFEGDETEVKVTFTDDGTRDDFYLFDPTGACQGAYGQIEIKNADYLTSRHFYYLFFQFVFIHNITLYIYYKYNSSYNGCKFN